MSNPYYSDGGNPSYPGQPPGTPQQVPVYRAQPTYPAQSACPAYLVPQPYPVSTPYIPYAQSYSSPLVPQRDMMVFVVSIIQIVLVSLGTLSVLPLLAFVTMINLPPAGEPTPTDGVGPLVFAIILILAVVAYELIVGIMGVRNAAKPEKANLLLGLGISLLVLQWGGIFVAYGTGLSGLSSGLLGIAGMILPVLYVIGAVNLKKQAPLRSF